MYEREGLLKPSRSDGNTRLYTDDDLERLEVILHLTRDLGVNLAGVEIILNMREKMEAMQQQIEEFVQTLNHELANRPRTCAGGGGKEFADSGYPDYHRYAPPGLRPEPRFCYNKSVTRGRNGFDGIESRCGGVPGSELPLNDRKNKTANNNMQFAYAA